MFTPEQRQAYQEHYEYEQKVRKEPPARLLPYLQSTRDSDLEQPGINCYQGIIHHELGDYPATIRFNNCHGKGGYRICLKMPIGEWYDVKGDDKFEVLDLIVGPDGCRIRLFMTSRFSGTEKYSFEPPVGWYDFDVQ